LEYERRLPDSDARDLAILLDIPTWHQAAIPAGQWAAAVWNWLADRNLLTRLPDLLHRIGRDDLVPVVTKATSVPAPRPASGSRGALSITDLRQLTDALLEFDEIVDSTTRRQLILVLPESIRAAVPDARTAREHVLVLLRTCAVHIGGRAALADALELYLPDSTRLHRFMALLDRVWPPEA
jgi:hypothetical protein